MVELFVGMRPVLLHVRQMDHKRVCQLTTDH